MIVQIPCDMLALYILQNSSRVSMLAEDTCVKLTEAYLHPILSARPSAVYLNVCYRRSAVPSEVFSTFAHDIRIDADGNPVLNGNTSVKTLLKHPVDIPWVSPYHRALLTVYNTLLSKGIDLCGIAMRIIKAAHIPLFLSVRPSDHHNWFGMGTEFLDKNALPGNGKPNLSRACVRNYFLNYIDELLRNYDPDGIEVDWLRTMPVVPDALLNDHSIISGYMRDLRKTVSAHGDKKLAVRVFATEEQNLSKAMDVCGWIADGSIDSFTAENFYIPTNFEIPIDQWCQRIAARNTAGNTYKLYCGSDWAVSTGSGFDHYMDPALIRGFASSCVERGADDIYLFNMADCNPETTVMLDETTGSLVSCVAERFVAAAKPYGGPRRYVYLSGCDRRYPIRLEPGACETLTIYTGKAGSSLRFYLCSSKANAVSVSLNGNTMSEPVMEHPVPGYACPADGEALTVRYCRGQFDQVVRFASPKDNGDIQWGYNTFQITNEDSSDLIVSWIEVQVQ